MKFLTAVKETCRNLSQSLFGVKERPRTRREVLLVNDQRTIRVTREYAPGIGCFRYQLDFWCIAPILDCPEGPYWFYEAQCVSQPILESWRDYYKLDAVPMDKSQPEFLYEASLNE